MGIQHAMGRRRQASHGIEHTAQRNTGYLAQGTALKARWPRQKRGRLPQDPFNKDSGRAN